MKKLIAMLFFVLSCFSFSAIFTEKDSVNVYGGVEATRLGGTIGVEYLVPTMPDVEIGVSTQIRILNDKNNYISNSLTYYYEILKPLEGELDPLPLPDFESYSIRAKTKEEKVPVYVIFKVGVASDLDSKDNGLYVAGGFQYGRDKFVRLLAETEDSNFRTTLGFGVKINSIS